MSNLEGDFAMLGILQRLPLRRNGWLLKYVRCIYLAISEIFAMKVLS